MAHLALAPLGRFRAKIGSKPAEGLSSDRLRALLAYLAVENEREHTPEQVATPLWPERPDHDVLSALRYALSSLLTALGDRDTPSLFLLVNRTTMQFNPASGDWLDVAAFQNLKGRYKLAFAQGTSSISPGRQVWSKNGSSAP